MQFSIIDTRWHAIDKAAWDHVAQAAGGSYLLAHGRLAVWRVMQRLAGNRVRFLQIMAGNLVAGQCVMVSRGGGHQVHERLMLLPEFAPFWSQAMQAVLGHAGRGIFRYGRSMSVAPSRREELAQISGVTIRQVTPYSLQVIEFADFADWGDYWRRLNSNVKRNVRGAEARHTLGLASDSGKTVLRLLPGFFKTALGKDYNRHRIMELVGDMRGLATIAIGLREAAVMTRAFADSDNVAWQYHVGFGGTDYYVAGTSRRMQPSPAWWLTIKTFEKIWQNPDCQRIVLGNFFPDIYNESEGWGLLQWRKFCQARDFPSEIVEFSYE